MARRKKGRALTGWLLVDKPQGITSAAVVNRARWLLNAQKAGHAGTLDPAATGLLVIAFGEATKALPYITNAMKAYEFVVRWGAATSTDDAEGEVIATSETRVTKGDITTALATFTGDIMQVPPAFSAVKVNGQRAYALARDGEDVALAARPLFVDSLSLLETVDPDRSRLEMVCGKGGYVRALARDLGEHLGCLGHVVDLRRTWSGPFALRENSLVWSDKIDAATTEAALLPLEAGLADLPECRCNPLAAGPLSNGNPAEVVRTEAENGDAAWASIGGEARALGTYRFGQFYPSRVFNRQPRDHTG